MRNEKPTQSGIDVLTLFREDLQMAQRVELFQQAADQLREDVDKLASRRNVRSINKTYDLTAIFNSHGNEVDAGLNLGEVEEPFITFTEGAEAGDIHTDTTFARSVNNSFEIHFNQARPERPNFFGDPTHNFGYWQARGLWAKGSIVAPIDVRYYSARMLDALIGDKYSQDFLNRRYSPDTLVSLPFEELLEKARFQGELVMQSNAVRELTSAKQIIETLLLLTNDGEMESKFGPEMANKITALRELRAREGAKLPVFVTYGTDHHAFVHEFWSRGIAMNRVFPGSIHEKRPYKHSGTAISTFFNGHHFDMSAEQLDAYARSFLAESMLCVPMNNSLEFGYIPTDNTSATARHNWQLIAHLAQKKDIRDNIQGLLEDFKRDPTLPITLLLDNGARLKSIDQ